MLNDDRIRGRRCASVDKIGGAARQSSERGARKGGLRKLLGDLIANLVFLFHLGHFGVYSVEVKGSEGIVHFRVLTLR
jgi:hypothetical protein